MIIKTINVFEKYGGIIGMRYFAESIFDDVGDDVDKVIVDFDNVEFIGRSFTQEYVRQKKKQNAEIIEANANEFIIKMIEWVMDTWK